MNQCNLKGFLALGAVSLMVMGCAGGKPPLEKLSVAEQMISRAETEDAAQYAPLDIRLAREKYQQAKAAMNQEDYDKARRLAEQAAMDAQVAETKATTEKAKKAVQELRNSIESLRREIDRAISG